MRIIQKSYSKIKQPLIGQLQNLTLPEGWMRECAEADSKTPTFIALDEFDKPLAWAILTTRFAGWQRGERAFMVYVHPRVRRAGYGKMLHAVAKAYMRKYNPNLILVVFPHDSQSHSFFKAMKEIHGTWRPSFYDNSSSVG
jgi:GNAT superfamily N-acetyltransferase